MNTRLITIAALAMIMATGCDKSGSATAKDITEARETATENSNDARQDANRVTANSDEKVRSAEQTYAKADADALARLKLTEAKAMTATAKTDFDVAMTDAQGRYQVANEKCGAATGVNKKACLSTAKASLAADQEAATASRDNALVAADDHR
jgi:hypothetical protein